MTASQIIKEIKRLSPGDRAEVESFIRHDDSAIRLTPAELGALARAMTETPDVTEASELKEKIVVEDINGLIEEDLVDRRYWSLAVLRSLLLKEDCPQKFDLLSRMMDHNENHRRDAETWDLYKYA